MLIISQDKSQIIECKNIIINDNAEVMAVFSDETAFVLGKYDSFEKCQMVLKKIVDHYAMGDSAYYMPPLKEPVKVDTNDPDYFENLRPYLSTYTFNLLYRLGLTSIDEIKNAKLDNYRQISAKREQEIMEAIEKYESQNSK